MLPGGVAEFGAQLGGLVVGPAAALNPLPLPRAAYGLIMRPNDFASYLLAIGICNLLLYFAFYIIMKVTSLWPGVLLSLEGGPPRDPPPDGPPDHFLPRSSGAASVCCRSPCSASSAPPWCGASPSSSSSRA